MEDNQERKKKEFFEAKGSSPPSGESKMEDDNDAKEEEKSKKRTLGTAGGSPDPASDKKRKTSHVVGDNKNPVPTTSFTGSISSEKEAKPFKVDSEIEIPLDYLNLVGSAMNLVGVATSGTGLGSSEPIELIELSDEDNVNIGVIKPNPTETSKNNIGYRWHEVAEPKDSQVGVRPEIDEITGVIKSMRISGRPKNKYGKSQGQHTTAYAVHTEVIVSATTGRTEEKARQELAKLFGNLLMYPALSEDYKDKESLGAKIKAKVTQLSKSGASSPLSDLVITYYEIRDALPGATLNTGVDSDSEYGSRDNTVGHGEATPLKDLRQAEGLLLKGGEGPGDKEVESYVKKLLLLYDQTSEKQLDEEICFDQRKTFLLSVAQAFPAVFQFAGVALATSLSKRFEIETMSDTDGGEDSKGEDDEVDNQQYEAEQLFEDRQKTLTIAAELFAKTVCPGLVSGNTTGERPRPCNFVASVSPIDDELGTYEIQFTGRPESPKEANTLGSHTTCEQLMKNAATNLFLIGGKLPTKNDLVDRIESVMKKFPLSDFNALLPTAVVSEINEKKSKNSVGIHDRSEKKQDKQKEKEEEQRVEKERSATVSMVKFDKGVVESNKKTEEGDAKPYLRIYVHGDLLPMADRYLAFDKHHQRLKQLIEEIKKGKSKDEDKNKGEDENKKKDLVSLPRLAEVAEAYMEFVDNRPTSVHFGGKADGRGEGTHLQKLKAVEGGQEMEEKVLIEAVQGLFDSEAVGKGQQMLLSLYLEQHKAVEDDDSVEDVTAAEDDDKLSDDEKVGKDADDKYVQQVISEFSYFLGTAYPNVLKKIGGESKLIKKISELIGTSGGGDEDSEFKNSEDL